MMVAHLEGRVLLITGAASGIGRATALLASSRGATVAGIDVDEEGLNVTVDAVRQQGSRGEGIIADVTDTAALATSIGALVADVGPLETVRSQTPLSFRRRYRLERWTGLGGPGSGRQPHRRGLHACGSVGSRRRWRLAPRQWIIDWLLSHTSSASPTLLRRRGFTRQTRTLALEVAPRRNQSERHRSRNHRHADGQEYSRPHRERAAQRSAGRVSTRRGSRRLGHTSPLR